MMHLILLGSEQLLAVLLLPLPLIVLLDHAVGHHGRRRYVLTTTYVRLAIGIARGVCRIIGLLLLGLRAVLALLVGLIQR